MATFDQIRSRFPSARGLSDNEIVAKLSNITQLPYEDVANRFGFTEKTSTGFFGGANDIAIEAGNAAAGMVGSIGEMAVPGNRFSRAIQENIVEPGEAKQSIPTVLAKRNLQRGLSTSEIGPQASAVFDYITENPGLAAAQAAGSFGPMGLAGKGVQAGSLALGLGAKAAGRVGLGATATVSGAAAGGDAAGDAYKLVMDTPREILLQHPQAQALVQSGVTDVDQIYEELATRAARRASVVPAVIGAVSGATGAESALLRGVAGGAKGVAKKVGAEALGEGFEEGATTYSGRKAAQQYNPTIDPMAGVFGSGLMGGALGAGTALPVSLANMRPSQQSELDLTTTDVGGTAPSAAPTMGEFSGPPQRGLGPTQPSQQLGDFDPFATIEARAAAGRPMSQGEQQQLLSSYFAAQKAGQEFQDLLVSQDERLKRVQGIGQQYQNLVGRKGDQMLQAQEVGDAARPITSRLEAEAAQQEAPVISALTAGAGAQNLPGMVKGAGTKADFERIMNPAVTQGITTTDVQPPVQRTQLVPQQAAPFSNIRMDRPTPVEPIVPAVSTAAKPITQQEKGAKGGTQTPQAKQAEAQGQELSPTESAELSKILTDIDNADVKNVLPASVKTDKAMVPGRTSLGQDGLKRVRDALVKGKEGSDKKSARIADALRNFATAYDVYLNKGRNVRRDVTQMENKVTPRALNADDTVGGLEMQAANVQAALAELGNAVGGNAKDIEAVVRLVKDMTQGKIVTPGKTRGDVIKALKGIDVKLSQAWNAAKQENFMREQPDLAATNPSPVRSSSEVKAAGETQTPLEATYQGYVSLGEQNRVKRVKKENIKAVADGKKLTDAQKKAEEPVEMTGMSALLQRMIDTGTPFETMLATALRETIADQANPVKVQFVEAGTPSFDPATQTITLMREQSPEVQLHEILHAALQSFVYKKWSSKDPAIEALRKSLKQVLNYKTPLTGKAKEVQDLLKSTLTNMGERDAVLELISYGTTLNEFRRALEAMPSKGVPQSFRESTSNLWNNIKRIIARMLGVKPSAASDILQASVDLLERSRKQTPESGQGNILEAAVASESQKAVDTETTTVMDAEAKEAGYADAKEFADKQGAWKTPTQIAFEAIGLGRVNGKDLPLTAKVKDNGAKVAQWVRENVPTLERVILNFNSEFSNGGLVNSAIKTFKFDQNTGYLQMTRIARHLQAHPELAKPFLAYMDGNEKALDDVKDNASIKAIADNMSGLMTKYINSLPANSKERRAFEKVPFSQYLLHPDSIGQVAGTTMGVAKLADILKTETRGETSLDEFKQYLMEREGSIDLKDPLYQMFEEKLGAVLPAGFISKAKYEQMGAAPAGMSVDTSRVWKFDKFDAAKGQYTFESSSTAKQLAENRKIEELSAAMLNTTAALSHTYASRNFFNGLLNIGRDENGETTANSVAFDTVDEINTAFPDRKIAESEVLKVSDQASRSPQIRWKRQRTGTWVQLPENSPTYGALQGKIIPGPVWNSMLDMHDRSPLINSRIINNIMATFKSLNTAYNPGTVVTNVLSNVSLAILHGIDFNTLGRASKLFIQFERNPNSLSPADLALMKVFYNSGAVLGQYLSSEVKQTVYDKLNAAIEPDSDNSYMTRVKTFLKYETTLATAKKYNSNVNEFYAAGDNIFRLAAFLKTAGNIQLRDGTTKLNEKQLVESGEAARDMFLDYDIDARAIRALRQSFLPFVSWPYAAAGVLGRIAIEKPWAMANMLMSLAVIAAATGGADDEEDRKAAPAYLREKAMLGLGPYMHMRVPFMGDKENPVYFNLGKYVPMFSLLQGAPGGQKTLGMELPGFATPGGPFVNIVSALNGYDPFTGKPIAAPTDETWDRVVKTGKYLYDTMAPTLVDTKFWGQIGDLKDGKTGPLGVEKSSLFLARNLGGLGLYQFNVEESQFMQDKKVNSIKKDFNTAMAKAKRNEYSKGYPDYAALDAELDELQLRLERRIAEIRGEE